MLEILKYPDPRLLKVAVDVDNFGPEFHRLLDAMAETMYAADGVGLAAPQVNVSRRAFLVDLTSVEGCRPGLFEFINPVITARSGSTTFEEGCLSVPGVNEEVKRAQKITVHYKDRNGIAHTMEAEDLFAVAIQHENDHLDGVLFVERLSPLKRRFTKRKLEKTLSI